MYPENIYLPLAFNSYCVLSSFFSSSEILYHPAGDVLWILVVPGKVVP